MSQEKPAIFINYRRALSTLEARLIYLMLQFRFPGEVFLDEETLEAGDRWRPKIESCVKNARVMITLIPNDWVGYAGQLVIRSKLWFDPSCHVRNELKTALDTGITIIPVLVNGADQPKKEDLPPEINTLFDTFNNALPLDFMKNPDVNAFEKLFDQIAKKAGLNKQEEDDGSSLFSKLLDKEFPLPIDLAQLLPKAKSPFVGLRPFSRDDARIFYGRSQEIYHLCFKIVKENKDRLFLLDGYSGTGKSSLLQAGLIPRIQGQGWTVKYRRREEDPIRGLKGVFDSLLQDAAAEHHPNKLLILDQVEEAITDRIEGLPNELEEMVQAIQDAFSTYPNYKFILSFRSEQLARIVRKLEKFRLPFDKDNTLHQLDMMGVTEAISGAASDKSLRYKLTFSPENLPENIARRLLKGWENYHIAPLIQVNMELLWERCQQPDGNVSITHHALENIIDRQDGLLGHFIKKVRGAITEEQADDQKILQLLDQYVQDEPASATRLDKEIFVQEDFRQETIFSDLHREFKKHYLLTEVSNDGQKATRLSHDVLAKVIRKQYQALTDAKLNENTKGYFDELMEKLQRQLYQLQYIEAHATLDQLFQLGIQREKLRHFMLEMTFFWAEANFEQGNFAGFWLQKWLKSNLLSDALKSEGGNLIFPFDKASVRQWLRRVDPNIYKDLQKKYYAPIDSVMVQIPGGELRIGEKEDIRRAEVTTFRLANVPVTWWKYGLYLFATAQESKLQEKAPNWGINGDHPVVNFSWYETVEYCNWLSEAQGLKKVYQIDRSKKDTSNSSEYDNLKWVVKRLKKANGYRLPSELEWEFAARGGLRSQNFEYAGSNNVNDVAWYDKNTDGKTHPVGKKKPNELGLYDMSGNAWEWCGDWHGSYPQPFPKDFKGAENGSGRVLRGGSWGNYGTYSRVSLRDRYDPNSRSLNTGFRVAQG